MPLYDYRCGRCSALFELNVPFGGCDDDAVCECGAVADRIVGRFGGLGRSASAGPRRSDLPTSMRGVGGSRERVAQLQGVEERIARRAPEGIEHAPTRMPVLSHEGHGSPVHMTARQPGTGVESGSSG